MNVLYILKAITPPFLLVLSRHIRRLIKYPLVKRRLEMYRRLHLACGHNILDGWANIELKGNNQVIGWNLTDKLQVGAESIELIYSEHFIEHVTKKQAIKLLTECYQLLKPNGVLRLSTPNLNKIINEYNNGKTTEWADVGCQHHPASW